MVADTGQENEGDGHSITVLPYLKGADFSHNNFEFDNFPKKMCLLDSVEWLRLRKTKLSWIPAEFSDLKALKKLDLSHNNLASLHGELICLKKLKYLYCHHNKIEEKHIPLELFDLSTLTVLDLSHNNLRVIPENLDNCGSLSVLNLSHNKLCNLNKELFVKLTKLKYLNLSDNELEIIPPELGRLNDLKTLIISNNPLGKYMMRQIERLKSLQTLDMANTQRHRDNIRADLMYLDNLVELNLSSNNLDKVPDNLIYLKTLSRFNLSENLIEDLPKDLDEWWPNLTSLNLSGNKLTRLPPSICRLCKLRRLYVNDNQLTFEGLPSNMGMLHQLEIFSAGRNNLESIPESISRCGKLKKLILTSNRLKLSDPIPLLFDLELLELSNNPDLEMPPRTIGDSARNPEFYNVDFSLDTQRRLAGDPDCAKSTNQQTLPSKDPIARKLRLRTRAKDIVEEEKKQAKVLKGMNMLATEKDNPNLYLNDIKELDLKPKRWDEILQKPPIDYSDLFDDYTGQLQGLTIWDIENFYPALISSESHGKFYDEDCYIVLSTEIDENHSLTYKIFYWIGANCTLDKKACSAIHAVGLRNHLEAQCRTIREEQGEESDEFLALFPDGIDYVGGHRTKCGFLEKEEIDHCNRIYRFHEVANETRQLHLQTVPFDIMSLDSRFVFLIDLGSKMIIWSGNKSKNTIKQRARLFGEKINKERRSKSELTFCDQGDEPQDILDEFSLDKTLSKTDSLVCQDITENDLSAYHPIRPILYQVNLTKFLELRQVEFSGGKLLPVYLNSNNVYVLDCNTDIFVWLGRKSPKIVRLGGMRVAQDLHSMINRPDFARITDFTQGNETQLFKTKFYDWDDVIAVDYTRTVESVTKTGPDLMKWMSKQIIKTDLSPLFSPRTPNLSEADALYLMDAYNKELDAVEIYIHIKGKKFKKLITSHDDPEFGHFYSGDNYVISCMYTRLYDSPNPDLRISPNGASKQPSLASLQHNGIEDGRVDGSMTNGFNNMNGIQQPPHHKSDSQESMTDQNDQPQSLVDEEYSKVYFWQGRNASQMGWLNFTFGLQKEIEANCPEKLHVIRMHQQKEGEEFLAHFGRKFIIHQGKRNQSSQYLKPYQLYQLRANGNPLTLRCIEIEPSATNLNSGFCYILKINTFLDQKQQLQTNGNNHMIKDDTTTLNGEDQALINYNINNNNNISNNNNFSQKLQEHLFVWVGSKASKSEAIIAQHIAAEKLSQNPTSPIILKEGLDDSTNDSSAIQFWAALGGKQDYETDATFMNYTRLFRCSNDKGYFCISEERPDFCQDDLSDDDIMILDNGSQVIIWIGPKSSEVEVRLACKSAEVYVRDLIKKEGRARQLMLTFKGKESRKFTKCFHAWGEHKIIKDPRGDEARFLKPKLDHY